jgi:hypothetical protein
MRDMAQHCVPDWELYDYGMHSLRIGMFVVCLPWGISWVNLDKGCLGFGVLGFS